MGRSLSSVLVVVVSLVTALGGSWIYLRSKAAGKPLKAPFEHPFTRDAHAKNSQNQDRKLLLLRIETPSEAPEKSTQKNRTPSDLYSLGVWLDVRLAGENQLVVSKKEILETGPGRGKPIEIASREECQAAGLFELAEFYALAKNGFVVLNLISRRPGLSQKILEVWGGNDKPLSLDRVALQSESDGTLKELREAQPRGIFGSSQATLIQLEVLSSLGLEGLTELKSDILISAIQERRDGSEVPRVRPTTIEEAHRRGLRRYAGPVTSIESAKQLIAEKYDGLLIENPEVFAAVTKEISQLSQ